MGKMERHLACKCCPERMKSHGDASNGDVSNNSTKMKILTIMFIFYFVYIHVLWSTNLAYITITENNLSSAITCLTLVEPHPYKPVITLP